MIELGRTTEICCEMDKLTNEDHTHHITPEEIGVYRNNWIQLVPIQCQLGIDLTSNKFEQPCETSNIKKIQLISNYGKVIRHLGGTGKNPGGILLMSIITKTDPALIDQGTV